MSRGHKGRSATQTTRVEFDAEIAGRSCCVGFDRTTTWSYDPNAEVTLTATGGTP